MEFVAIDVETANPDLSSICQIGIVSFDNGAITATWQRLVNPEDYFNPWNMSIHGISEGDVADASTLPDIFSDLQELLSQQIVVSHTAFDRVALSRATDKYGLPGIACTWLDSAKIVRRAWPKFACSGYGLGSITEALGIVFEHHVAQEDARAAGEVVLRAIAETGISISEWLKRVTQPILPEASKIKRVTQPISPEVSKIKRVAQPISAEASKISQEGNPESPLIGEVAVFTGTLSIPRREAAKLAANAGCSVTDSINKATTLLIVGDQDIRKLAGHEKSSKHRKAEGLISKGHQIRILGESDFRHLVELEE